MRLENRIKLWINQNREQNKVMDLLEKNKIKIDCSICL